MTPLPEGRSIWRLTSATGPVFAFFIEAGIEPATDSLRGCCTTTVLFANPPRRAGPVVPRAFDPRNATRLISFALRATRLLFRTPSPPTFRPGCPAPLELKQSSSPRSVEPCNPNGYPYSLDTLARDSPLATDWRLKPRSYPGPALSPTVFRSIPFCKRRPASQPGPVGFLCPLARSGGLWETVPVTPSPGLSSEATMTF